MRTNMKKWEIKRKFKIASDRYLGDRKYLSEKYRNIYGGGDYSERIEQIRKNNRNRYILCIMVIVLVSALFIKNEVTGGIDITEDKNGFVTEITRNHDGKDIFIPMEVYGEMDGEIFKRQVNINVGAVEADKEITGVEDEGKDEGMLGYRIDEAARMASSEDGDSISLPTRLSDGTAVYWKEHDQNNLFILFLIVPLMVYGVYRSRFQETDKEEELARESVMKELPEFLGRLTLLLGAGMILTSAFEKIMTDSKLTKGRNDTYFYSQMNRIAEDFKRTKTPVHKGIEEFAKRSRVKEFIRVSGIISDNVDKGTELTEKLDAESGAMWFARKQNMEEKGRMAESKLIAPLMLMLVILVVITVAPALMEM